MMKNLALFSLVVTLAVSEAEDFLYVLARPAGAPSEVHWIPVSDPLSARVLLDDLPFGRFVHRHRDELWRLNTLQADVGNLVGKELDRHFEFRLRNRDGVSSIVRQGDYLYSIESGQIWRQNVRSGERIRLVADPDMGLGLALHEDRLYFSGRFGDEIKSCRVDGKDRRDETVLGDTAGLGGVTGLSMHGDSLYWGSRFRLWKKVIGSNVLATELTKLPENLEDITITDEAIYWISDFAVWRWRHGSESHERIYELGDTRFFSITSVTASPYLATITKQREVVLRGRPWSVYQLLMSEDLHTWSPDYVRPSLFSSHGTLEWLSPQTASEAGIVTWNPQLATREAYFAAREYELESPFDSDEDSLPDYWERRHFNSLSPTGDADLDGDGLSDYEEAQLFTSPLSADTDGAGLTDVDESMPGVLSEPAIADTDGDGLNDFEEVRLYQTNPTKADSDFDGFTDAFEVSLESDPTERTTTPDRLVGLMPYDAELMVHFEFDSIDHGEVRNAGVLGGSGRLVGPGGYLIEDAQTATSSVALGFSREDEGVSYLETSFTAQEMGMSDGDSEFTIAFWTQMLETQLAVAVSIASPVSEGDVLGIELHQPGSEFPVLAGGRVRAYRGGGSLGYSPVPLVGAWQHVAWTVGKDGWKVFFNGNPVQVSKFPVRAGLPEEATLRLGTARGDDGISGGYHGAYDDLRIYRVALPPQVIKLLAR